MEEGYGQRAMGEKGTQRPLRMDVLAAPLLGDGRRGEPETGDGGGGVWKRITPPSVGVALLCCYVFFKTMKPSEQYLTKYMVSVKGLSEVSVDDDVYPLWTYCACVMAVLAFLFTDFVGYRNVVRGEALAYLATRVLLVWGTTLLDMQLTQVFYAMATSTEIGYLAYVYHVSRTADYQRVASVTRASILVAELLASVIAQVAVTVWGTSSLLPLNYVSMISVVIACLFAAALPRSSSPDAPIGGTGEPRSALGGSAEAGSAGEFASPSGSVNGGKIEASGTNLQGRWDAFKRFYGSWDSVRWSVWAAAGTCGLYQVENYNQNLWEVQSHGSSTYNGAVGAVTTVLGVFAALAPSYLSRTPSLASWITKPEPLLAVLSAACGALLFVMAVFDNQWAGYIGYAAFKVVYCFTATIASAQVATCAKAVFGAASGRLFGMVYGFNTLVALALESLLQFTVGPHVLHLHVRAAFQVYAAYFLVLGVSFGLMAGTVACCRRSPQG